MEEKTTSVPEFPALKSKRVSWNFALTLGFVKGGEKKRRVKRMYSTHLRADSEK